MRVKNLIKLLLLGVLMVTSNAFSQPIVWDIAQPEPDRMVVPSKYPSPFYLFGLTWTQITPNQSNHFSFRVPENSVSKPSRYTFLRTSLFSSSERNIQLKISTKAKYTLFLNHQIKPTGSRSKHLTLPLKRGINQIFLIFESTKPGPLIELALSGMIEAPPELSAAKLLWEVQGLNVPESVAVDHASGNIFVSNYAQYGKKNGSISVISNQGKLIKKDWKTQLSNPTGLRIMDGHLYVVERHQLTSYALDKPGSVVTSRLPKADFLNDLAFDSKGIAYVTDTSTSPEADDIIVVNGATPKFLPTGRQLHRANGIHYYASSLLVGSSGNGSLQQYNLNTGKLKTIIHLFGGIIDGIQSADNKSILVSLWEGALYLINPNGTLAAIPLNLPPKTNAADIAYDRRTQTLYVPTFYGNSLRAYRVEL